MSFNPRNAVKKERKFEGKTYKLQDRLSSHDKINSRDAYIARLKHEGWSVRTRIGADEWGYKIVDIYIRRK